MPVRTSRVAYGGWPNCVRIENGICELIVTADVGPRVIFFGFIGKDNEMCNVKETLGATGGDEWRIYGGHRLWHSPENMPRSYEPDNEPIAVLEIQGGVHVIQPTEKRALIRKEMEITLVEGEAKVRVTHRLVNEGLWDVELSAWALTVLAPGGLEVIPQVKRETGLLGNRVLGLWPYSRMNDPRVTWGENYILLKQDENATTPFKFGSNNEEGWAAYFNHGHLFVKHFAHKSGAEYPDFGCSFETYTHNFMLEMETLSPLVRLAPGQKVDHLEKWELFDNVSMPEASEEAIEKALKGKVIR